MGAVAFQRRDGGRRAGMSVADFYGQLGPGRRSAVPERAVDFEGVQDQVFRFANNDA